MLLLAGVAGGVVEWGGQFIAVAAERLRRAAKVWTRVRAAVVTEVTILPVRVATLPELGVQRVNAVLKDSANQNLGETPQ